MIEKFKYNWKVKGGVALGVGILVQILNGSIDIGIVFIPAAIYAVWSMIQPVKE